MFSRYIFSYIGWAVSCRVLSLTHLATAMGIRTKCISCRKFASIDVSSMSLQQQSSCNFCKICDGTFVRHGCRLLLERSSHFSMNSLILTTKPPRSAIIWKRGYDALARVMHEQRIRLVYNYIRLCKLAHSWLIGWNEARSVLRIEIERHRSVT